MKKLANKMSGLGKSLDMIFMENNPESENVPITLNIIEIEPNQNQPRTDFDDESLKELARSIARHGVIQPIVVKPISSGKYKIIAGERRFRAAKSAGLVEVPVIIKDVTDTQVMELALVENLQRENLNAIEEAKGYKALMDNYGFTQVQVAETVGKSRSYVANAIRLLNLPEKVVQKLKIGEITSGHARALLTFENNQDIEKALEATISKNLSVRQLEELVKKTLIKDSEGSKSDEPKGLDAFYEKIESDLYKKFGRKVKIILGKRKKSVIQIEFSDEEDLSSMCRDFFK